jgi:hypothetical protein
MRRLHEQMRLPTLAAGSASPWSAAPDVREDHTMRRLLMVLVALLAIPLAINPRPAEAQVSVSVGINLPGPPSFVIIPGTPVAYAPAVPANFFFYGGSYYLFANGAWYTGPTYGGPWVGVPPAYIPYPILSVPVRYYKAPPPQWKGWGRGAPPRWDPAWGHEWKKANKDYEKAYKESAKQGKKGPH